jgi:hypothetical protein
VPIDHREHHVVHANPKSQEQDGREGERAICAQPANALQDVVRDRVNHGCTPIALFDTAAGRRFPWRGGKLSQTQRVWL